MSRATYVLVLSLIALSGCGASNTSTKAFDGEERFRSAKTAEEKTKIMLELFEQGTFIYGMPMRSIVSIFGDEIDHPQYRRDDNSGHSIVWCIPKEDRTKPHWNSKCWYAVFEFESVDGTDTLKHAYFTNFSPILRYRKQR